jgi:hypothetical protein
MHAMKHVTAVHRGDLVFVNQRGRLFYAKVVGVVADARPAIEPLDRAIRVRTAKPAEIVDHWARSRSGDRGPAVGQLSLEDL